MFRKRTESPAAVMIMDTNEVDLLTLEQKFELLTLYKIKTFSTPESLISAVSRSNSGKREQLIAVVSLDSLGTEPQGRGWSFIKALKESSGNVEIIVLSSSPEKNLQVKAIQLGAFTAIRKTGNSFLRIQNDIKWILAQKELKQKRQNALISIGIFFFLLFLSLILWLTNS
jgi:DNA-binding NtrC family response regulator